MSVLMWPPLFPMLFRQENVKFLRYLGRTKNLEFSRVIHARFIVSDQWSQDNIPDLNLIDVYSKCEALGSAHHNGFAFEVVRLFKSMVSDHDESCLPPNEYISGLVLSSCLNIGYLSLGRQCHGYLLKSGLVFNQYVKAALVSLYSMLPDVVGAMEVLLCNPVGLQLDNNLILDGLVEKGYLGEALIILRRRILAENMAWDNATYIGIFGLCARLKDLNLGRQVHNKLLKSCDVESDESVCNAVINMYGKCKEIVSARKVFDRFESRNVVIWTTMLASYLEHGSFEESLKLFSEMRHKDVVPNESTFFVLLTVSSKLFSRRCGKLLHALSVKTGFNGHKNVENTLIDMYSRTGDIKAAEKVFLDMTNYRDIVTWNMMICGYSLHGFGNESLALFKKMLKSGEDPNYETFVGVLNASGHVEEGLYYLYELMKQKGVKPGLEHYMCIINMLIKGGRLKEALSFIVSTPSKWDAFAWSTFLTGCHAHGNYTLGIRAAELIPDDMATKVSKCCGVAQVREVMEIRGERGCSWMEIKDKTYVFASVHKGDGDQKFVEDICGLFLSGVCNNEKGLIFLCNSVILSLTIFNSISCKISSSAIFESEQTLSPSLKMEVSPSSSEDTSDTSQQQCSFSISDNHRLYLVPFRWWKEAEGGCGDPDGGTKKKRGVLYDALPASSLYAGPMKILNSIFKSDLAFNLIKKEEEDDDNYVSENNGGEDRDINGVSGRNYALVSADMWLEALKWHSESKGTVKASEDDMTDVYPLQLKLSILQDTNTLGVRISKKDNAVECFRRACKIFSIESEVLYIWDFSGQTANFLLNDNSKNTKDVPRQPEQDILLELQVYGLSDLIKNKDMKKDDVNVIKGSLKMNGCMSMRSEKGSLGLTGLQNLGNTCFMNSSLQCLAHTPKLVDYFLGDHRKEINHDNPLGMNGEIAMAFGDLLKTLWAPGATAVPPRTFKSKLAHFAPQFSGFNQHDSQELLAFLLDGLHEDLNRVKCKPYVEAKDGDGRADEDIADEYWQNHLARNDSIIVDVCQGQYRSTLVCPICRKVSVTFDPFMYLSLPLPSTSLRTMTLTVVSTDGSAHPNPVTVSVPKQGKFEDLVNDLRNKCSLGNHQTLMVAEVYNNHIIRFLGDPTDSLSLIRDDDRLVAYKLQKDYHKFSQIVFVHQQIEKHAFGLPLVACGEVVKGHDIRDLYFKVLKAFTIKAKNSSTENNGNTVTMPTEDEDEETKNESCSDYEIKFYLSDDNGNVKGCEIVMDELLNSSELTGRVNIVVCWSDKNKMVEEYDQRLLRSPVEIYKPALFSKRPQESISLYKCLEAFLKEEPLGPEDMWYCPGCKKHRQASKKLDLWRLPEILVIHLKRFSYSRFLKNKLETYVDFPIHDLDLSTFVAYSNGRSSHRYMLYAISNHYGSMGGGHYTAFIRHDGDRWYDFDDSHVSPIDEDRIKTSAAYVLFYRRLEE